MAELTLATQTLFAELLQRCLDAEFDTLYAERGRFVRIRSGGRLYWHYRVTADSERRQLYVGPVADKSITDRVNRFGEIKSDYKGRREIVRALVAAAKTIAPTSHRRLSSLRSHPANRAPMNSDGMHPDVYAGFAASIGKKLGAMSIERERQHVRHYAELTALHESCHAVAHVLTGAELISVEILPSARGLGYTLPNLETATDSQMAIGCFAGCIGELLRDDAATFVEATAHDVAQAVVCCLNLCSGGPSTSVDATEFQRVLRRQWEDTVDLLLQPKSFTAIHLVAAALLAQGRLTGAEVQTILEQATRPLPRFAKRFREAKADVAEISELIPELAARWLNPCGTRLREGAFEVTEA